MSTTTDQQTGEVLDTVVERFQLKSLVEACLLVEEGVAQIKDIDMGMMMGAGIIPGPFAAADERGLDEIVNALDNAPASWGDWTEAPVLLRRLVAQGRLGKKTGQGFYPYPSADAEQKETVLLEWRDDVAILWLNGALAKRNPPGRRTRWISAAASNGWRVCSSTSVQTT